MTERGEGDQVHGDVEEEVAVLQDEDGLTVTETEVGDTDGVESVTIEEEDVMVVIVHGVEIDRSIDTVVVDREIVIGNETENVLNLSSVGRAGQVGKQ